jgi:hypothetical protein
MERPHARRVQREFFYDYRTSVALFPKWQKGRILKTHGVRFSFENAKVW